MPSWCKEGGAPKEETAWAFLEVFFFLFFSGKRAAVFYILACHQQILLSLHHSELGRTSPSKQLFPSITHWIPRMKFLAEP